MIVHIISELKKERKLVKNELRSIEPFALHMYTRGKRIIYQCVSMKDGRRQVKEIARQPDVIYKLAHQAFYMEKLRRIDHNIRLLEHISASYCNLENATILNALPKHFDELDFFTMMFPGMLNNTAHGINPVSDGTVKPVKLMHTLSDMLINNNLAQENQNFSKYEWQRIPYCENTSFIEQKCHISRNGIKARSKSEIALLELYDNHKWAYHYDELVILNNNMVSPDFIGIRDDGMVLIHEHVGLLNNDEYRRRHYAKLELYKRAGFEQGRNLILSFDKPGGIINLRLIENTLEDWFST